MGSHQFSANPYGARLPIDAYTVFFDDAGAHLLIGGTAYDQSYAEPGNVMFDHIEFGVWGYENGRFTRTNANGEVVAASYGIQGIDVHELRDIEFQYEVKGPGGQLSGPLQGVIDVTRPGVAPDTNDFVIHDAVALPGQNLVFTVTLDAPTSTRFTQYFFRQGTGQDYAVTFEAGEREKTFTVPTTGLSAGQQVVLSTPGISGTIEAKGVVARDLIAIGRVVATLEPPSPVASSPAPTLFEPSPAPEAPLDEPLESPPAYLPPDDTLFFDPNQNHAP